MTPKEKANELVDKYLNKMPKYLQGNLGRETSKQCALICVDELLKSTFVQNNTYNYWTEVKQEINKINKYCI